MGLLQKLKSALGLNGAESTSGSGSSGDVDVTVEREPSTESEDAVKGTETATTESEADVSDTDAGAATEPDEGDAETDEAVEEDVDAAVPEAEPDTTDDAEAASEPASEPEVPEGSDDPVTEIKGIGPAYAKRLSGLGIDTVGELAVADAAEIAAETDLSESRVDGWIERAKAY